MKGFSTASFWVIIFLVFILLFMHYQQQDTPDTLSPLKWKELGEKKMIISTLDEEGEMSGDYYYSSGETSKDKSYKVQYLPGQSEKMLEWAETYDIPYATKKRNTFFSQLMMFMLPLTIVIVLWLLLMRQLQGGGNKAMSFGKSKAKLVKEGEIKVTFKDVAGVNEARDELQEIVEYLKDPKKFSKLGGKIPKGVLLIGPPGTGKTLLARAIAGEAAVPFFSMSGSDFVEMFVGVGASRVRDLFDQAKKARPCIIFIDEIDAVGRSRFAGHGGGHDEREQTLNQLLVEMDGFAENEGVILVAATNRPDVLDPALLRPGRFDRQVTVDLPDIKGREMILQVHARNVKMAKNVKLSKIARGTPGFSGADLANLINEAALLAARRDLKTVGYEEFEEAKDRVMMGPERRSMVITEKEKKNTAYHEAGHALVAHFTEDGDPVHKVTIVPRGSALGVTWVLPSEERLSMSRKQLINQLYYLMGGRAAEIIKFDEFTTGAANDIERATSLAHRMVCHFGMSDRLGPRAFSGSSGENIFLGRDITRERNYSEQTSGIIDEEVKRLIDESHDYAIKTLQDHKELLERVSEALIERETLGEEEFLMLVDGKELPPMEVSDPPAGPSEESSPATEEDEQDGVQPQVPPIGGPDPQPST